MDQLEKLSYYLLLEIWKKLEDSSHLWSRCRIWGNKYILL